MASGSQPSAGGCFGLCPRPSGSIDTEVYRIPWTRSDLMMLSSCCCCELGYRWPEDGNLWSSEVFSRCCCQRQYYKCECCQETPLRVLKQGNPSWVDVAVDGTWGSSTYPESAPERKLNLGSCTDDRGCTSDRCEYSAAKCCWQLCDTGCGAFECCCNQKAQCMCLHYTCSCPKVPWSNTGLCRRCYCNSADQFQEKFAFGCCGVYCCGKPPNPVRSAKANANIA